MKVHANAGKPVEPGDLTPLAARTSKALAKGGSDKAWYQFTGIVARKTAPQSIW